MSGGNPHKIPPPYSNPPAQVAEPPPTPSAEGEVSSGELRLGIAGRVGTRQESPPNTGRTGGTAPAASRVVVRSKVIRSSGRAPTHAHAPAQVEAERWRIGPSPHARLFRGLKVPLHVLKSGRVDKRVRRADVGWMEDGTVTPLTPEQLAELRDVGYRCPHDPVCMIVCRAPQPGDGDVEDLIAPLFFGLLAHLSAVEAERYQLRARDAVNGERLLQCVICWKPQVAHEGAHEFARSPNAPSPPDSSVYALACGK